MKNVKPPEVDDTIVIVRDGDGFELRYFNRLLGCSPIGPRLARGEGLPELPVSASTFALANDLRERWQVWLDKTQIVSKRKGRKTA